MIEHASNCHGEWNFILAIAGSIPFVGVWLSLNLTKIKNKMSNDNHH